MKPENLEIGAAYYRITYARPNLTIPGVDPWIFIGTDVFDSENANEQTTYWFQDTASYFWSGSAASKKPPTDDPRDATDRPPDPEIYVESYTLERLPDLTDLEGAISALREALTRESAPR
jgi:hypothetical protein